MSVEFQHWKCKMLCWTSVSLCSLLLTSCIVYGAAFDAIEDVKFELYTRDNRQVFQLIDTHGEPAIAITRFDSNKPTRIFVHGYRSKHKVLNRYAEAYLNALDCNFIAVNWIEGASTANYYTARGRVKDVARSLAVVIDSLVDHGLKLRELTVVGHSLGSHIAGLAAKQLRAEGKIAVIFGLDPASVFFDFLETEERLCDTDADYVQVVHTDSGHYSFEFPIGHADFYPNGGKRQPGCTKKNAISSLVDKCSHVRAHALFLESLSDKLPGVQCTSYEEISRGKCTNTNVVGFLGGDIKHDDEKPFGVYYLETYDTPKYGKTIENFSQIEYISYFD